MTETLEIIEMAQGEGKWFRFLVTRNGVPIDVTALECSFVVATNYEDTTYLLEKETADFDKNLGASGILRMNVTSGESLAFDEGTYKAELKVVLSGEAGEEVDIRRNIDFKIRESLFA
jgi:protease II